MTMKKKLYLLLLACFVTNLVFSQSKKVIFVDNFMDNRHSWDEFRNSKVSLKIDDGVYHFNHKRRKGAWATSISTPIDSDMNFMIGTTITKRFGTDNHGYGITWGWINAQNYYVFLISGDGNFQVGKYARGKYVNIIPWTRSKAIQRWNSSNKLVIKKTPEHIDFFINGKFVGQMPFEEFAGNKVGFLVNQNLRIDIENLTIFKLKDVPKDDIAKTENQVKTHKIKRGETLFSIARRYGVTLQELRQYNPQLKKRIFAGEKLRIPVKISITIDTDENSDVTQQTDNSKNDYDTDMTQAYPPDLYIENLRFFEPSFNRALDGTEKGEIRFDLINKGRGNASDIEIKLTPLYSAVNLDYNSTMQIEELAKNAKKSVVIPISADMNVQSMKRQFRIDAVEANGFDADPAVLSFETEAFKLPDLQIKQLAIDDNKDEEGEGDSYGNGNSVIEPGESIEVIAFIQNFGQGRAENVKAEVKLGTTNRHITYPEAGKIYDIGDIEAGDYKKLEFYFYTSRRYDEDKVPFTVQLSETRGNLNKEEDLKLKLGERTQNIVDIHVTKIENQEEFSVKDIDEVIMPSDVDKYVPKSERDGTNTLAVIMGVENYKYAPNVDYAAHDAQIFYKYAKSLLGIPERNIYYRVNEGATSGEFNKLFSEDGWLDRRVATGITDVIVFYAGHGAPDTKSKESYLIPHDIDPNYATTGFSLYKLYESLAALEAKSVTVFLDACFSGVSRTNEMLLAGTRAVKIKPKNPVLNAENMAVLSASSGTQYSSAYNDKYHGLFTYYLLKGMQGDAKENDNKLTLNELFKYVEINVAETAGQLDREQNPTFQGKNGDMILVEY